MSHDTWAHRAIEPAVRLVAGTGATPNQLTTCRLATGLAAMAAVAVGDPAWTAIGGGLYLLSMLLDRADGQLARMTGTSSAGGHRYDVRCDNIVTTALFVGIGVGLRHGSFGWWAPAMGIVAGTAVTAIFWVVERIREMTPERDPVPGGGGFDPDDTLFVVAPLAWLDWLEPFLIAAVIGAPLFLASTVLWYLRLRREKPREAAS